jgi:thiamine kinase-like enzyme
MRPDPGELAHRHVPGAGTPQIRRLRDGLVNHTYRVQRDGQTFALRLSGNRTLATHGEWECRVLLIAAGAGLAPPVVYCDPAAGILVSQWVEGRSWTSQDTAGAGIDRMAALMRRIHALMPPQPPRSVTIAGWVDYYAGLLKGGSAPASARARSLRPAADERLHALTGLAARQVLCHGDLHPLNLIQTDRSLAVLDWEYSHVTDPYWDLAAWSSANDWGAEARWELMRAYGGADPTREECQRFDLVAWLYDYVCVAWSAQYAAGPGRRAAAHVAARAKRLAARLDEYPVVAAAKFRHTSRPDELP